MIRPERTTYTPLDFLGFREGKALEVVPKFQRRAVWGTPAKAYLIDTLLRGLPVPPIYLRTAQSTDRKRTVREVIDGQQRITAVLDYLDGKYALSRSLDSRWAGREFLELRDEDQDAITSYGFYCEVLKGVSDAEVLEIFARLNLYSIPLNAQELRNGKYFGFFKQSVYGLAHEHVEFWRRNRIVTERGIARMQEVELTSELLIMQLAGLQDKKKSISKFYADYDEEYPQRQRAEQSFRATIDIISEAMEDGLAGTEFRRSPLFYSLYGAVYHRRFGIPKLEIPTPKRVVKDSERRSLRDAVQNLSAAVALGREDEPVPSQLRRFVNACLRQTDNLTPRTTRLDTIYRAAF